MDESKRESVAVTPPQNDTPAMRDWLEQTARDLGWTELRWADETDRYGSPMGRLTGVRPGAPVASPSMPTRGARGPCEVCGSSSVALTLDDVELCAAHAAPYRAKHAPTGSNDGSA